MRSTRLVPLAAVLAAVLAAGCDSARPIEQRSAVTQCARCHGFPPPPGVLTSAASHPQSTACEVCHGATVVSGTELVPGGTHMNGQVDFAAHPMPYLAQHRAAALQGVDRLRGLPRRDLRRRHRPLVQHLPRLHRLRGLADELHVLPRHAHPRLDDRAAGAARRRRPRRSRTASSTPRIPASARTRST